MPSAERPFDERIPKRHARGCNSTSGGLGLFISVNLAIDQSGHVPVISFSCGGRVSLAGFASVSPSSMANPGSFSSPLHVLRVKAVRLPNPLWNRFCRAPEYFARLRGGNVVDGSTFRHTIGLFINRKTWRHNSCTGAWCRFQARTRRSILGRKIDAAAARLHRGRCTDSLNQDTDSPGRQQCPPAAEASLQVSCIPPCRRGSR
jgi:hypothetical protein